MKCNEAVVPTCDMDKPIFTQEIPDTQEPDPSSELEALIENLAQNLTPVPLPGPDSPQVPSPPKSVQTVEVVESQAALPSGPGAGGESIGHDAPPCDSLRCSKAHEDCLT